MNQTLFIVLCVVIGFLIALIIFVAAQPSTFRVQRTAMIGAPAATVFPLINDLRQWNNWSPFEKLDPQMNKIYSESTVGPGAFQSWSGNNKAGEGRLTILDNKPNESVRMSLEFTRPFKCNNQVMFKLEPKDSGTTVSWIMDGENNFVGKAFHLLINMDKMLGKDFEEGLSNLDKLARHKA